MTCSSRFYVANRNSVLVVCKYVVLCFDQQSCPKATSSLNPSIYLVRNLTEIPKLMHLPRWDRTAVTLAYSPWIVTEIILPPSNPRFQICFNVSDA